MKARGCYPVVQLEVTDAQENILHTPSALSAPVRPVIQSLRAQMHTDTDSHMHISADMQCQAERGGNFCLPREWTEHVGRGGPALIAFVAFLLDGGPYLNVNR